MTAKATKKTTKKQAAPQAPPAPDTDKKKSIHVHHLTRVEGHGNIVVAIDDKGTVQTCRWEVPEAPRFFEAMLLGRSYRDVHQITSRICGICSIGHQLASLQATEDALGVRPSDQTHTLRKLALHGENLQSHLLHIGYLVLPDLMGVDSVIPLAETHKEQLVGLIALRRLSNDFSAGICGRTTHPQRLVPGGMARVPDVATLKELKQRLEDSVTGLKAAAELIASVADKIPNFTRKTEYIGLTSPAEYALYWGQIGSSEDTPKPARFYKDVTKEYSVPQSTAKWARNLGESIMVGALARYNINADKLSPLAKEVAKIVGLPAPSHNPYHISLAQLVECVHSTEDSIQLIDALLTRGVKQESPVPIEPKAGKGVGAVEVPRGILYHAYEYDGQGRIVQADCVIPTNQNHANIQKDLEALVPQLADKSEAEIELLTSMLVRAYDPCISCSTHHIDMTGPKPKGRVTFVRV